MFALHPDRGMHTASDRGYAGCGLPRTLLRPKWESRSAVFTRAGVPPFRLMDRVGLDVVLDIEEHYAAVRDGIPEGLRKLLREYTNQGRLGVKTGSGFYDYPS
jgi:hypothetical protein